MDNPKRWRYFLGGLVCLFVCWWGCGPVATPPQEQQTQEQTIEEKYLGDGDASIREMAADAPETIATEQRLQPEKPDVPPEQSADVSTSALTYYAHTKAILAQACVTCHQSGGIGPFALDSYEAVLQVKASVEQAIASHSMPPWPADDQCAEYTHRLSLSASQRAQLLGWLKAGAAKGDPKDDRPIPPTNPSLPRIDETITLPAYTPQKNPDDYRCFLVPWKQARKMFITGIQVTPGAAQIDHHMAVFLADGQDKATLQALQALDQNDPGPGYECFGGSGANTPLIAAWAPGVQAQVFPKGTGIEVPPGSMLVVQMHYSTAFAKASVDQTKLAFMLAPQVERIASMGSFFNYDWPRKRETMTIPAGKERHEISYALDFASIIKRKITLYGMLPHQHLLGRSIRLSVIRKDGTEECLINIPRWDFNWQFFYFFEKARLIQPGDTVKLTCVWDNSAANQPLINGKKATPRDVTWGEKTQDEMCVVALYATCTDLSGTPTFCYKN